MRKCQFDPEMARSPPRSSGHFWAQLAISAISAPNWQLFLAISTLNWHLLQEIQKMEDQALSNTGKARDAGEERRRGPDREGKEMRYIPLAAF